MRTTQWKLIAPNAFALTMFSCATLGPPSALPRLAIPPAASEPCTLSLLPADATEADGENLIKQRGAEVVLCDGKRQLAIDTLIAERDLIDRATAPPAPWWRRLWSR